MLARARGAVGMVTSLEPAVGLLALISFVSSVGIGVMIPLIPLYAVSLGATPIQLGLLTSAFSVAMIGSQLGSALVMDRLGSLGFVRGGVALYALANFLIATAASPLALLGYRALAGLGAGPNLVATRVYLSEVADRSRLAFVNGVLSASASAGSVLGPAIGGIVVAIAGLRAPFVLVGVTSGLAFLATLRLPRPAAPAAPHATEAPPPGLWSRPILALLLANLALLAGYGGFITTYAPFATQELGWSVLEVAVVFSVFGAGSIVMGPWLSHLADRAGRRQIAMLATLPLALFGLALVLAVPRLALYAVTFVAGGGIAAFTASWFAMLATASPAARRGRTFGLVNAISNVGVVIGAMVASLAWQGIDIRLGLITASVACVVAGAALLLHPADRGTAEPAAASVGG